MSYRIGVDIGGTFTDFVLQRDDGSIAIDKVLSTPEDDSEAVMRGLEQLARQEELGLAALLGDTEAIVHGTTVADNALIEMKGATTGLVTTDGFRDEIELRRGYKEDIWDVRLEPPPAIVPRRRRVTVPERLAHDGTVVTPLDEDAARRALRRLGQQDVESVAVVTLFSFVNPAHERRLAELATEELPGVEVSLSHEVMPKAPEFERASTTVVNAFVGPRVTRYLDRLTDRLREAGFRRELLVMQSSGGLMSREYIRQRPIRVLASGPAGGVIGGAAVATAKGAADLLCVDMGGTSYDVSVVRGGEAAAEPGWNWHHRYVIGLPMVSVETLGAGGGSIAQVKAGALHVGPESAGADPGPVCYGRGGTLPTVTDANLVLGLLSADAGFAGGSIQLSHRDAEEAIARHVAESMGCSVDEAAFDIWRVVNANMSQAVQRLTAEKGTDPRTLTMLAYGGNGPVHAAIQAEDLGISRVLVPRTSPTFSALGLLAADPLIDEERSYLEMAGQVDLDRVRELWAELAARAAKHFEDAGFDRDDVSYRYQANLRYPGQNWSLAVPLETMDDGFDLPAVDGTVVDRVVARFHDLHEELYSYARREVEPELTGVRLTSIVAAARPPLAGGQEAELRVVEPPWRRPANLGAGRSETGVFDGAALRSGDVVEGPAIVEESFTTVVVYPGWRAQVDAAGDYVLVRDGQG